MRDDAVLGRALPLGRGLGPWRKELLKHGKCKHVIGDVMS